MGLATLLARRAVRVAHVLVVESPGSARLRMLTEHALMQRGWSLALSPADADVLLVCGDPGPQLKAAIERVWEQMPGPRARVSAHLTTDVESALAEAAQLLADVSAQRRHARDRPPGPPGPDGEPADDGGADDDNDESADHEQMDHGDMDHDHMDHGDMEMAPDGIALAGESEDHDGLTLDALTIPLGPILAHWPAALVLQCILNGDLIITADAEWLDADLHPTPGDTDASGDDDPAGPRWHAARYCDDAARLLSVAGWDAAANAARRHRDTLLGSDPSAGCLRGISRTADQISRSRSLRWALRGLLVPDSEGAEVEWVVEQARGVLAADLETALGAAPRAIDLLVRLRSSASAGRGDHDRVAVGQSSRGGAPVSERT